MNNLQFMDWLLYKTQIVFIKDHRINLEALVLGTLAEHASPFTMALVLTNLGKDN